MPRDFTLPGASLDVERTVARRAERKAVTLEHAGGIGNPEFIRYLNRLSSLLFILARAVDLQDEESVRLAQDLDQV